MKPVNPTVVAGPNKLTTAVSGGTKPAVADVFWFFFFITVILFLMALSTGSFSK